MKSHTENPEFDDVLDAASRGIKKAVVWHWHFQDVKRRILRACKTEDLVLVVGPAGVGKSTLGRMMVRELNAQVEDNQRVLHAMYFRSPSSHGSRYPWLSFYGNWADGLGEPLIYRKVDHERIETRLQNGLPRGSLRYGKGEDMRNAVSTLTKQRGVRVVFADEAANLVVNEQGRTIRDRLDVLRDISDKASEDSEEGDRFTLVLLSTPRIFGKDGLNLSGEIIRRMKKIYFPRYHVTGGIRGEGFKAYQQIIKGFVNELPSEVRPTFSSKDIEWLLECSVGCVGILSKLFMRAIVLLVEEGPGRLEMRHFMKIAFDRDDIKKLEELCEAGEENFERFNSGWGSEISPGTVPKEKRSEDSAKGSASESRKKNSRKRVGKPKASRPRTGMDSTMP